MKFPHWIMNLFFEKSRYAECSHCRNYTHLGNYCERCGQKLTTKEKLRAMKSRFDDFVVILSVILALISVVISIVPYFR